MGALRSTEFRTISDAELQRNLEQMLNQRKFREDTRRERYVALSQPEPVNFCAEENDVAKPLPSWVVWGFMVAFSIVATVAVWAIASWGLPVVWGMK